MQEFLYAFFPLLFGLYPYTSQTEKQLEAMRLANVEAASCSVYELSRALVTRLLASFKE